jgi:Subtilisin inhibitor-like
MLPLRLRTIAAICGMALLLGACAGGEPDAATRLTLVLFNPITAEKKTYSLTCDPAGGSAPRAAGLCRTLEANAETMLPDAANSLCCRDVHSRYIGIEGTFDGRRVETALPFCDREWPERLWLEYVQPPGWTR